MGVSIIKVYEYLEYSQPRVLAAIEQRFGWNRRLTRLSLVPLGEWKLVMEEPPRPGLAGVLPEEATG